MSFPARFWRIKSGDFCPVFPKGIGASSSSSHLGSDWELKTSPTPSVALLLSDGVCVSVRSSVRVQGWSPIPEKTPATAMPEHQQPSPVLKAALLPS